jgi:hypothetical protein
MTDQQMIDTLRRSIATLTRFIESKSTPNNAKATAMVTRQNLQDDLDRMLARFVIV